MVDFRKLREAKAVVAPTVPREIFNQLPKPEGINDLYVSQDEVLQQWYARRADKDVVLKLHTGGGKTLVGLLVAQSVMNEKKEPVLYLAPTVQLVNQIVENGSDYGINAVPYVKGQELSDAFLSADSVLVGAYEILFAGKSKFDRRWRGEGFTKCGTIILDDAHAAVASVRSSFSVVVDRDDHEEEYLELANMFRPAFKGTGRLGTFEQIMAAEDGGVLEVPFWAWHERTDQVLKFLSGKAEEIALFSWPLTRDNLAYCHCIISQSAITITSLLPSVDLIPTFDHCPHRVFMSATIADDSELIRTFGVSQEAAKSPITSISLAGVSERMILVPELMGMDRSVAVKAVKRIAPKIAEANRGVAILVPSGAAAAAWTDVAKYPATSTDVALVIEQLQAGETVGPVVLANRYDGIDLPRDACRLLVISDLPRIMSDYDVFRSEAMAEAAHGTIVAQRLEQGMGRGARGAGDWCVVVLLGRDLVGWIGRKENVEHLTASTRKQLEMGREISRSAEGAKEFVETVQKAFQRDKDWVLYHAQQLATAAAPVKPAVMNIELAALERTVYRLWRLGQYTKATNKLDKAIHSLGQNLSPRQRAWLRSLAARVAETSGDRPASQTYQHAAYAENNSLTRPLAAPTYSPLPVPGQQAKAIVSLLSEYDQRRGILARFEEGTAGLTKTVSANVFEEALKNVGIFLGFEAERPESQYDVGPDVLWLAEGQIGFVIEAKSRKESKNPLYKSDHAQLLESAQWFSGAYPEFTVVRVSVLDNAVAEKKASTADTRALTSGALAGLVTEARQLLETVASAEGKRANLEQLCDQELRARSLTPSGLQQRFLSDFQVPA